MIKSKDIEVTWNNNYQSHYLSRGYDKLKPGEHFVAKIEDVPLGSRAKVICVCDNCGEEFQRCYFRVAKHDKHFCKKPECKVAQLKHFMKLKYGVESANLIRESKEKMIKTFKSHYGKIENPIGNKELSFRKNQTHFEHTGYKSVSSDPNIKKIKADNYEQKTGYRTQFENPDIIEKSLLTKRKKNTIPTSSYQLHLHEILLASKLNYVFKRNAIDIAYPFEMIAIEYNGPGHFHSVLAGAKSLQDAKLKDEKRANFLIQNNWKVIFIDHSNSKKELYSDDAMVRIIILCKQHLLNTNHNFVRIDVDNAIICGSGFSIRLNKDGSIRKEI